MEIYNIELLSLGYADVLPQLEVRADDCGQGIERPDASVDSEDGLLDELSELQEKIEVWNNGGNEGEPC